MTWGGGGEEAIPQGVSVALRGMIRRVAPFYADLHIHSKYSRACSKDCDLEHLTWWARRKGITLVGTGDVTHPAWFEHLRENLVAAEPGLFRLRPDLERDIGRTLPAPCEGRVRFMLSVEISTIYKRGEHTRKTSHNGILRSCQAIYRTRHTLAESPAFVRACWASRRSRG
ncbi:hypothetical protein GCM10012275_51180 [Longimycelium tulufanense]|uniref:Uncharacterized protein n=1 Tax=Longimycelium tulufanense TaxID=907463 RepID=A0A8J3CJ38_9PSEU|nr:endonuclease Q family protein [Longimycelium tulufanense]GGM74261.1 hypothetical protein GCM10012275_51180 [Longimycelium tulufanense]